MSARLESVCERIVELFLRGEMDWSTARRTLADYGADDSWIDTQLGVVDPDKIERAEDAYWEEMER